MIITDSAKIMLQEALTSSDNDCLQINMQRSACGTSLFIQMGKLSEYDTQAIRINDIALIMDQEAEERTSEVMIDCEDGQLVMRDPAASACGCG